mgnify:CR=1 FL=1
MTAKTRFLFATDIHGAEQVWRKFLNSAKYFKLDALILSGDMTGKMIIPIIKRPDGKYEASVLKTDYVLTKDELPEFSKELRAASYIPYETTPKEAAELRADSEKVEKLFEKLQVEIVKYWLTLVPEKVPKNCKVIISPGNDDKLAIDPVIKANRSVIYGESNVVSLDEEHEVACCGWSNPTPWNSPRECSEEELLDRLEKTVSKVKNMRAAVFCFHVPPYNSEIDRAPKLDKDLRPVYEGGRPVFMPVGSKAVRTIIEKYQPLLGLHGHIHESPGFIKIGRTQCLNPGSEYSEGILRAYLVEIESEKILRLQRVEA